MITVDRVSRAFGSVVALDDVSLSVAPGEVVVVIGPSGSGKSTLVRCIHQLESIDSGSIYLDGELLGLEYRSGQLRELSEKAIASQRKKMGMVFQQFNLFPHLSVLENIIEAPLRVLGETRRDAVSHAGELLDHVGIRDKEHAYPRELSGGQRQRVAIARALAMKPRVMLFDEPTSALDPELVDGVLRVMQDLARSGMTMIVVTHEMEFAYDVADRCVFMSDGKVVEVGDAKRVLREPESPRLREFLARDQRRLEGNG